MDDTASVIMPKVVVFDLDDTVWTPEMWLCAGPPFTQKAKTKTVHDRSGQEISIYPGAKRAIVDIWTKHKGSVKIAWASKCDYPAWARTCLELIEILPGVKLKEVCSFEEIYKGEKTLHFKNIRKKSGVSYEHMIFFDNEYGNITTVSELGVLCVFTPEGMQEDHWEKGLLDYTAKHKTKQAL